MGISWTCPFCNRPTTIRDDDIVSGQNYLNVEGSEGKRFLNFLYIVCPNTACRKFNLMVSLWSVKLDLEENRYVPDEKLKSWDLIPESRAQSFPGYIPEAIRDDYNEACLIVDLSPKASATLSRRCLQQIIRGFWGVKKGRLVDEIDGIKNKVDAEIWKAMKAIKDVGNIGAHGEKDIDLIIDVDPAEAKKLIKLIEVLLKMTYIADHDQKQLINEVITVAEDKKAERKQGKQNTQGQGKNNPGSKSQE
jgi:Domain of unknown function (DUF4145)